MEQESAKNPAITVIQWVFVILTFCGLACGGTLVILMAILMGDPRPATGSFTIKNKSTSQIYVTQHGNYICAIDPGQIGCKIEMRDEFDDVFTAKMTINGKVVVKEYNVDVQEKMLNAHTTLSIDHRGELKVESTVARN